jgi:cytochrome P450
VEKFDIPGSSFSAVSPEQHRQRRAPLEKFFSKAAITKIEDSIQSRLRKFCDHLERSYKSHKVVPLDAGFSALTSDIIHQYTFGFNSGNLDQDDFNENVRDGINALFRQSHISFFFPIIQTILNALPLSVLQKLNPYAFALASQKNDLHRRSAEALAGKTENGSIIEHIAGPNMPEHMRTPDRLADEGFAIIIGGTETTARSLGLGAYHLISNENIRRKLREELRSVMPTPESKPSWNQLEQLPYLVCDL